MGKRVSVVPVISEYEEWFEGSSTIKDLETMFQLLYLKSTSPRKDADAFKSYVSRMKQNMESVRQNPQMLFIDSAYYELFQHNKFAHRFHAPAEYDKVNMDNAVAYYSERLGNAYGMYYSFVGSFTEDQIKPLIEKYIGGLPSKQLTTTYKDLGMEPKPGMNNFTLRKGSEQQGMLIVFYTGKHMYSAKTNFRLDMLNEVANNKVTQRIREKMSAIYGGGINGRVMRVPREEYRLQAFFPCGPDNIQAIDTAFAAILSDMRKPGGITEKELKEVTEPAIKHNQVKLKENQYWRDQLLNAYMNDLNAEETILGKEEWIKSLRITDLTKTAAAFYNSPNVFKAQWLPALVN
jgi:zinc protease